MRLINVNTWNLEEINEHVTKPSYGILSHTWEEGEEVTFEVFKDSSERDERKGWAKITSFLQLCKGSNLQYAWIDTCCIDKSSSAELSEAINSMWRYYKNAERCFVYLCDFDSFPDIYDSRHRLSDARWFTRGWTLQELLAPRREALEFYDQAWNRFGNGNSLNYDISTITGINPMKKNLRDESVAKRMSWAANRTTSRPEDMAYCLMGLFDVNMPLLYGEGAEKAFYRLQLEILNSSDDDSIFAWQGDGRPSGLLASSPADFKSSMDVDFVTLKARLPQESAGMTSRGMRMSVQCFTYWPFPDVPELKSQSVVCIPLNCARLATQASMAISRLAIHVVVVRSETIPVEASRIGPLDEVISLESYPHFVDFLIRKFNASGRLCDGLIDFEDSKGSDLMRRSKGLDLVRRSAASQEIWKHCEESLIFTLGLQILHEPHHGYNFEYQSLAKTLLCDFWQERYDAEEATVKLGSKTVVDVSWGHRLDGWPRSQAQVGLEFLKNMLAKKGSNPTSH